ncbi:MAG: hypothetical protein JEZ03_14870, partial [Bacteroidales bacterium]|nr:hypothetical protein [Bacteroidales bacterium]
NLDDSFVYSLITAMNGLGLRDKTVIDYFVNSKIKYKGAQTRAAIYTLINNSEFLEESIVFYIEGLKSTKTQFSNYHGEWLHLREGLESFTTKNSIKKIIETIIEMKRSLGQNKLIELSPSLIKNVLNINNTPDEILHLMVKFLDLNIHRWDREILQQIIGYFNKSNTRAIAFEFAFKKFFFEEKILRSYTFGALATDKSIDFIIDFFNQQKISEDDLWIIYNNINDFNNDLANELSIKIYSTVGLYIPKHCSIEDIWRKHRYQKSFDILFKEDIFISEIRNLFNEIGKEELTDDDLWEFQTENRVAVEIEEAFPESVAIFVSGLIPENGKIKCSNAIEIIETKKEDWKYSQIKLIRDSILYNKSLSISEEQKQSIENWIKEKLETISFKTVLDSQNRNDNFLASTFLLFFRKFEYIFPKKILLDMLMYPVVEDDDNSVGFTHLIGENKLNHNEIKQQVIINLNKPIKNSTVFINHLEYAIEHELIETYPKLFSELTNQDRIDRDKTRIINRCITLPGAIAAFKGYYYDVDFSLKLELLAKLKDYNEIDFVRAELFKLYENHNDPAELKEIISLLIKINEIKGIAYSIDWIRKHKTNLYSLHSPDLKGFTDLKVLPYIIELLELRYDESIKNDRSLDRLWGRVCEGLIELGNYSWENNRAVANTITSFISDNNHLKDVEFMNTYINQLNDKGMELWKPGHNLRNLIKEWEECYSDRYS